MNKYSAIRHVNSNNSRRRGLLIRKNAVTGKLEKCNHITYQIVRDPNGVSLPRSPLIVRRSKYVPHIGKKQIARD